MDDLIFLGGGAGDVVVMVPHFVPGDALLLRTSGDALVLVAAGYANPQASPFRLRLLAVFHAQFDTVTMVLLRRGVNWRNFGRVCRSLLGRINWSHLWGIGGSFLRGIGGSLLWWVHWSLLW